MFDFLRKGGATVLNKNDPTVDEMLDQEDLSNDLAAPSLNGKVSTFVAQHTQELIAIATKVISEQQAASNEKFATTYPRNATFLLTKYVSNEPDEAIPVVVPPLLRAFKVRGIVHSVVAKNVNQICVAAFVNDFEKTTDAVEECLADAELLHCILRQLAASSHVAELVLNLMGNAIGSDSISLPGPDLFAQPWIKHQGHIHLVNFVKVAMASETMLPFFGFMNDLFQRGLSPHIGTIVDSILDVSESLILSIVEATEESARCPTSFPLLGEGLKLLIQMVALLQKASLSQSTEVEDYTLPLRSNVALRHLMKNLPRLIILLNCEALALRPYSLGVVRLRIIDICMALHRCNRKDSDDCLLSVQFHDNLMRICEAYPTNDMLLCHLREVLMDGSSRAFDGGRLLRELERAHLFARLIKWVKDPAFTGTTLRALALAASRTLSDRFLERPYEFSNAAEAALWTDFTLSELDLACGRWFAPITGEGYAMPGSGCDVAITHRPVVSLVHGGSSGNGWGSSLDGDAAGSPTLDSGASRGDRYASIFDDAETDDVMLHDGPAEWNTDFDQFDDATDVLVPTTAADQPLPSTSSPMMAGVSVPPEDEVLVGDHDEEGRVKQIQGWNDEEFMDPPPPPPPEDDESPPPPPPKDDEETW